MALTRNNDKRRWLTMDFERTYTLTDIARKIGKPRTTLNEWLEQFRQYIPSIGSGRTTRYKSEAIEIFSLISKMKEAGEPNELIHQVLRQNVPEIAVTVEDEQKPMLAQIADSYMELHSVMQEMKERYEQQQKELLDRIERLEKAQEERDLKLTETLRQLLEERRKKRFWSFLRRN
jgi:transposase-like protein